MKDETPIEEFYKLNRKLNEGQPSVQDLVDRMVESYQKEKEESKEDK